jgi:hypothetical protein
MNLNMRASAVLVWLADGEHLAHDSFATIRAAAT